MAIKTNIIDQWNKYSVHRSTCKHASVWYLYIIYAMWNKFVWKNIWKTPGGEKNEQFTDFAIRIFKYETSESGLYYSDSLQLMHQHSLDIWWNHS